MLYDAVFRLGMICVWTLRVCSAELYCTVLKGKAIDAGNISLTSGPAECISIER